MPSLIPRKLRRYRKMHPYSFPLLFTLLDAAESMVKFIFILAIGLVGYVLFKNWTTPEGPTPDVAAQQAPALVVADQNNFEPQPVEFTQWEAPLNSTTVPAVSTAPVESSRILADQQGVEWISQLRPSEYIIQFASTPDEQAILEFTRQYLATGAVIYPFKRTPSGRPIFGVATQSVYASLDAAKQAIEKMPAPLRESRPWIRPVNQLQQAVAANAG